MARKKKLYKLSIYSSLKGELNFITELLCKMGIDSTFEEIKKTHKQEQR